jgi:hypothetical protein
MGLNSSEQDRPIKQKYSPEGEDSLFGRIFSIRVSSSSLLLFSIPHCCINLNSNLVVYIQMIVDEWNYRDRHLRLFWVDCFSYLILRCLYSSFALIITLLQRGELTAPQTPFAPSTTVARLQGRDILRHGGQRKNRFLFSFPGLLVPGASGGRVGELADLGTKNPVLYLEFPQVGSWVLA